MKNILKNKVVVITFLLALLLVGISGVLALTGRAFVVTQVVNTVCTPVRSGFAAATHAIGDFWDRFTGYPALKRENDSLKLQLAEQEEKLLEAEKALGENAYLRDYLELKSVNRDFSLLPASIVGRENANVMTIFTLNRGSVHGVEINMPVIDGNQLVGIVTEVGPNWAKVLTLTETTFSVGCCVERTGDFCVAEGSFSYHLEGLCRLRYLPEEADVQEGDRIITSGLGEYYPEGLTVGRVEKVVFDETAREVTASVRPTVDFSSLREIMVLTGYTDHE